MPAARKRVRRPASPPPAAPAPEPSHPSFWEAKAVPFLQARAFVVAMVLIAIAAIRVVAAYPENGITFDEPGHMACGLQFLAEHVYRYESQHPPLARVMSALGPYLDGARPTGNPNQDLEGVAVMYRDGHVLRTLVLMRLGVLPFFLLGCFVVYLWGARYFDRLTAVLATGLFTLIPPVLAHAGVATTDMPLTACLGAAFLALLYWAEQPDFRRALLLGVATGLMVLSKFTALAYLPAAVLLALIAYCAAARPGWRGLAELAKRRAASFAVAVLTGALVIWAGYLFSFGKVPVWGITLPAPEIFDGVRSALHHNNVGHEAYLFGQLSLKGWWYYFPVVLAVKTPIAFLVLLAAGLGVCWRRRRDLAYLLPWAFALGILIPAMMGSVNIGVRHILPVYLGFSLAAATGLAQLLSWASSRKWAGAAAAVLVLWMVLTGILNHPDYLAYFNEFAGSRPEHILVDSDLDWGQDTVRLARWLRENHVPQFSFLTLNLTPKNLEVWPGVPPMRTIDPLSPVEGITVVSPTVEVYNQFGLNHRYRDLKPWFDYIPPTGRLGSYRIYYVPPGSLPAKSVNSQ